MNLLESNEFNLISPTLGANIIGIQKKNTLF